MWPSNVGNALIMLECLKYIEVGLLFWGGGGASNLGIFEWGRAAGTLEPLAYTRAGSAVFCYPILA